MRARVTLEGSLARPAGGLLFDFGDVLYDATVWRRWLLVLFLWLLVAGIVTVVTFNLEPKYMCVAQLQIQQINTMPVTVPGGAASAGAVSDGWTM